MKIPWLSRTRKASLNYLFYNFIHHKYVDLSFSLKTGSEEQFIFWAETAEKRQRWLTDLKEAIDASSQVYWKSKFDMSVKSSILAVRNRSKPESPSLVIEGADAEENPEGDKKIGVFQMLKRSLSSKKKSNQSSATIHDANSSLNASSSSILGKRPSSPFTK